MSGNGKSGLRGPAGWIALLVLAVALAAEPAWAAKNVILMVSDGAGYNTWLATSMYRGKLGAAVYDQPGWLHLSATTHPRSVADKPGQTAGRVRWLAYSPELAWDTSPSPDGSFAAYAYLKRTATDSAAAGTALASGVKTYNNAINWTDDNAPLRGRTIAELAKAHGRAVGVVTTVQLSHATPACLGGAHNPDRDHYAAIANELLMAPYLDVIIGCGHPEFDDAGRPRERITNWDYVGGKTTWEQLKAGTHPSGRKLIQTKEEFEALVSGPTPARLVGVAQVATTLQQRRPAPPPRPRGEPPIEPFETPMNTNVPSLETLVLGALNCLDDDPDGFYLGIEGGAVDWANHANDPARMIEEQIDFLKAVEAVVRWIEDHGGWNETLLILTADHDCGLPWGPKSDVQPFAPIEDRGAGRMPGLKYNARGHSNSLVPLLARGAGSERLSALVVGRDPQAAQRWGVSGRYADNTAVFVAMFCALKEKTGRRQASAATAGAAAP